MSAPHVEIEARVRSEITLNRDVIRRDVSLPYRRGGLALTPGFEVFRVTPEALTELQADPWVDVRNVSEMGAEAIAAARRNRVDRLKVKSAVLERDLFAAREQYRILMQAPEGSARRLQAANARTNVDRLTEEFRQATEAQDMAILECEEVEKKAPVVRLTPVADALRAATPTVAGLTAAFGGTLPGTTDGHDFLAKQGASIASQAQQEAPPAAPAVTPVKTQRKSA